jgi:5-methylthioadenosine/S-adenosylhomocysteine deaminase
MEHVDTLITHAHMFTMRWEGVGYVPDGALAIRGGRIAAVGATGELSKRFRAHELIDGTNHALLPGLINAHAYTPIAGVRGVAQDVTDWMDKEFRPFYRHAEEKAQLSGCRLSILEGLRAGTTTFVDHAEPFPGWAQAFMEAGVRARLGPVIHAFDEGWTLGQNEKRGGLYGLDAIAAQKMLDAAVSFVREWNNAADGRIRTMLMPAAADFLSREQLLQAKRAAQEAGVMIQMYVAQGQREIAQMLKRYGKRTPAYLDEMGFLDDQLVAIHLTEATDELMAQRNVRMVFSPSSAGLIDAVVPPALAFREAGGMVALGSDTSPCNMFTEMKLAALFSKISRRDPTVMPAWEVLRMATIQGARAIGWGDEIGSLEVGKQADLILVDLNEPSLSPVLDTPIRNIVPNLVYSARGHEVKTVMVAGRVLVREGQVLSMDQNAVRREAQAMARTVADRVAADSACSDLTLVKATRSGRL